MRPNKYNARKTTLDGITFDSKREANRYAQLKLLERAGQISGLELQPRFEMVVNGKRIGRFTADFAYQENGRRTIEEVKSAATRRETAYRLRKKVFEACFPDVHLVDVA